MRITALIVGGFTAVTVFAVGSQTTHAQSQTAEAQPAKTIVKVEPGNTLSGIAKEHQTTYIRLFDANEHIADPDVIYPGQDIRVPSPEEQLASRPLPAAVAASAPKPAKTSSARTTPQRSAPAPAAAPSDAHVSGGVWDRVAQCESGGRWNINTGNGYYGGLQFSLSSWRAVGGSGYPHQASKAEQIKRAEMLKARQGWGAWPACTKKLGLR